MNDYLIATASTCDIDAGWLNEHNVPFISYSFIIDDVPYEDDCKEETKQFSPINGVPLLKYVLSNPRRK